MLVLARKQLERIFLTLPDGTPIVLTVVELRRDKVKIGIDAPAEVAVDREEIYLAKHRNEQETEGVQ